MVYGLMNVLRVRTLIPNAEPMSFFLIRLCVISFSMKTRECGDWVHRDPPIMILHGLIEPRFLFL